MNAGLLQTSKPSSLKIQTLRNVDPLLRKQIAKLGAAQVIEKIGGRDRVRTCDPLLAKQVLSQLSYTPKPMFLLILNQLRIVAPLETVQCAKSVPNKLQLIVDDCANVPDTVPNGVFISFACLSNFCSASLFICNFICEYFLKT
jgi:hypothetical protein